MTRKTRIAPPVSIVGAASTLSEERSDDAGWRTRSTAAADHATAAPVRSCGGGAGDPCGLCRAECRRRLPALAHAQPGGAEHLGVPPTDDRGEEGRGDANCPHWR